jgi:hypothetical protein
MTYPSEVDSWIGSFLHWFRQDCCSKLAVGACTLLDRLEITYGNSRTTLVSPRDRAAFLQDLSAHVPGLRIDSWRIRSRDNVRSQGKQAACRP